MDEKINLLKKYPTASFGRDGDRSIYLDNCPGIDFQDLSKFDNLEKLSITNGSLTTLNGFPTLSRLKKLELSDNKIVSGLEALSEGMLENLTTLNLSGNKISDIQSLAPLKGLAKLQNLDLFGCPVTKTPNYRKIIFSMLPSLQILDQKDMTGKDISDTEDEEEFEATEEEDAVDHSSSDEQSDLKSDPNHVKLIESENITDEEADDEIDGRDRNERQEDQSEGESEEDHRDEIGESADERVQDGEDRDEDDGEDGVEDDVEDDVEEGVEEGAEEGAEEGVEGSAEDDVEVGVESRTHHDQEEGREESDQESDQDSDQESDQDEIRVEEREEISEDIYDLFQTGDGGERNESNEIQDPEFLSLENEDLDETDDQISNGREPQEDNSHFQDQEDDEDQEVNSDEDLPNDLNQEEFSDSNEEDIPENEYRRELDEGDPLDQVEKDLDDLQEHSDDEQTTLSGGQGFESNDDDSGENDDLENNLDPGHLHYGQKRPRQNSGEENPLSDSEPDYPDNAEEETHIQPEEQDEFDSPQESVPGLLPDDLEGESEYFPHGETELGDFEKEVLILNQSHEGQERNIVVETSTITMLSRKRKLPDALETSFQSVKRIP